MLFIWSSEFKVAKDVSASFQLDSLSNPMSRFAFWETRYHCSFVICHYETAEGLFSLGLAEIFLKSIGKYFLMLLLVSWAFFFLTWIKLAGDHSYLTALIFLVAAGYYKTGLFVSQALTGRLVEGAASTFCLLPLSSGMFPIEGFKRENEAQKYENYRC